MKYQILFDYREGYKFEGEEFESIDEAVKYAIGCQYSMPFLIVQVIDWKAEKIIKKEEQGQIE